MNVHSERNMSPSGIESPFLADAQLMLRARGVELGIDTFDCAMPTRIGRHGMALVPDPEKRWRVDLAKARWKTADEPLLALLPVREGALNSHRIYLIDPLGNAMMFYAPSVSSKGMLEDMKRLLRLSSIG